MCSLRTGNCSNSGNSGTIQLELFGIYKFDLRLSDPHEGFPLYITQNFPKGNIDLDISYLNNAIKQT
ncbi:MAG: hypothetical protein ACRECH_14015 [Nitrososphaerales archaeon]